MNTDLRQKSETWFWKKMFKLMINAGFREKKCKTWENIDILNLSQ